MPARTDGPRFEGRRDADALARNEKAPAANAAGARTTNDSRHYGRLSVRSVELAVTVKDGVPPTATIES